MNIKKFLFPVLAYIMFFMEIIYIYASTNVCTFEHCVQELKNIPEYLAVGEYLYDIENNFVDEEDLYRLVNISGYLMKKEDEKYLPVDADLLLMSDEKAYRLNLYANKRTDVYYLDQSDPDSKDLYVGWFGKFPAKSVEESVYKIGFILSENNSECVLWTDKIMNTLYFEIKNNKTVSDFLDYIDNKSDYIVCITVKDEASQSLTEELIKDFRELGLAFELPEHYRWSYLAVLNGGEIIYEKLAEEAITYDINIDNTQFSLQSAGYNCGNNCSVKINWEEYAVNGRGINIVVFDKQTGYVIDSVCIDTFADSKLIR